MSEQEDHISLIIAHAICRPRPEPTREPYGFYPVENHAIDDADNIMSALKKAGYRIISTEPTEAQIEAAACAICIDRGYEPYDISEVTGEPKWRWQIPSVKIILTAGSKS